VSEKGWNKLDNTKDIKEVEVKALFNLIDKDRSGELSLDVRIFSLLWKSLYIFLQEARKACKLIRARFEITEVDDWMDKVDSNKDGSLSYEEFKKSLSRKMAITELSQQISKALKNSCWRENHPLLETW
jgi:Ca2+-binding EF-hand superfamily protein